MAIKKGEDEKVGEDVRALYHEGRQRLWNDGGRGGGGGKGDKEGYWEEGWVYGLVGMLGWTRTVMVVVVEVCEEEEWDVSNGEGVPLYGSSKGKGDMME